MRKILPCLLGVLFFISISILISKTQETKNEIDQLREQHKAFLKNSPLRKNLKLSKKERKAKRLHPNKYFEREWELTMNPLTGRPQPEKLFDLQEQIRNQGLFLKVPGEKSDNKWVERGPNNVGGRTRAIMFDPNDSTHKRVFAGGVSGGLWVNDDITDVTSSWSELNIPQNLAISCITYDPNNTMTFYVGTGESYVFGDVNGNGVWKSTDAGASWTRVFGGSTGDTNVIFNTDTSSLDARLSVNSPSRIAGNYFGTRALFGSSLTPITRNLVIVNDSTTTANEGCNSIINEAAIKGNIAVIYRGNCQFSKKVLNAQNAGAVAVIVINNVAGDVSTMEPGIYGDLVSIPSIMISMADGQTIANEIKTTGVNVSINGYRNYHGYTAKPGAQHINDIKVRNIGAGNSEVYVAASNTFHQHSRPNVLLGPEDSGLYKSINNGASWSKIPLLSPINKNDYQLQPNDIEISADNTIWVSTTGDLFNDGGSEILSSSDGINFILKHTVPNGKRSQIAVSSTNASKIYVLAELESNSNPVKIVSTDDAFATSTSLPLPNSIDPNIPDVDFTRGQGFYNLVLEVDPTNDAIVYAAAIDIFRSANSGNNWSQISEYYTNTNLSRVHVDQHAFVFHPSDSDSEIAVSGNDGGVYYATSLSNALPSIQSRNKNYNTLQFYNGAIGQEVNSEKFLAGSQDNGSQFINSATAGINSSTQVSGGDGTYVFIDKDNEYIVVSTQNGDYYYADYETGARSYTIDGSLSGGQFVNPAELDDDNDYLYSDGSKRSGYRINRYQLESNYSIKNTITSVLLNSSPTAFKSSPFITTTLFVGTTNGKLFRITNATATKPLWVEITGNDFVGSISCIELGTTENDILVSFHNYGVTSVFYSADGGVSWQNKEGDLPDLPVKAIMMNPLNSNEVIIGTDLGVWATPNFNDVNPNWFQSQNGMKDVKVTSFDLRTADNTVLASTYGRGLFTSQFTAAASQLSVDDRFLNDLVKVYPTVSNGKFQISAQNQTRKGSLNIFDMNGKPVYTSKVSFNKNPIQNISINVSSGMYIVKFKSESKQSTHKIIIE